jgi:predicted acyl esterase
LLFQKGTSPAEVGLSPPNHSVTVDGGMRIECDVAVALADGVRIYVDLYRPEGAVDVPVVIS